MSIRHLHRLLEPGSVAVFGASERPGSVGATVWRNLRAGHFAGPVWPVNPKHARLDGQPVFAATADLPHAPDLAVICTPAASVPALVEALGTLGTRAVAVVTGGFTPAQRQAVLDAARPHLTRVLGPNGLGLLTPRLGLNASYAHTDALAGDIAFVSQSGAIVTAVLDWAKSRRIGFSHLVSIGACSDVDFGDLLDHLASDAHTRSILLYIESLEEPRKFMSAARAAARNKPVIVVKAGRAGGGVAAASTHTGALAGEDAVFDAAIRRAGMLRVDTLRDLFMAAQTLARFRGGREGTLTVMTNGGGAGVLAADAAGLAGVPLRALSPSQCEKLDAVLPPTWSRANPIDIAGDAPVARYAETLQVLLADEDTGAILFMHAPTAIVRSEDIARACAPLARQGRGRVMACWLGDTAVAEARRIFEDAGLANYGTPEEAVRAVAMLATYRRNQALLTEAPTASENGAPDLAGARRLIDTALAQGRERLDEAEAESLLGAYGIPTLPTRAAGLSGDALVSVARAIGYPVALKIRSPDIIHKSDVGGVVLALADDAALRVAAEAMLVRVRGHRPQARLDGFTVQAMARRPRAHELIIGASVDAVFGPVLLFGQGGTAVEVVADRAIALPPLNRTLARELIARTRVARLLAGYRDRPAADLDAICDALIALSQMLADLPELVEVEANPLWADDRGVLAVDARVRLSRAARAGRQRFAILPYPAELTETLAWDGREILIRPIRPEDEAQHLAFIQHLAPEDVRLRYFSVRRSLPRSELARLVQIDYAREMAFIALARSDVDGWVETLGVVRSVTDPNNIEAEFAIILRSDLKRRGLGRLLLQKMINYTRAQGTQRLVADVLRENRGMRDLALGTGFHVEASASDDSAARYVLDLQNGGAGGEATA